MHFNLRSALAIYRREMARAFRTAFQSILSPVLTTSLYFVVFGSVIGARREPIGGVPYGAFIIPGLLMLTLLGETTSNASFGIYMPRFTGTIYELLSAPVGVAETLTGFVGAARIIHRRLQRHETKIQKHRHLANVPYLFSFVRIKGVQYCREFKNG